VPSSYSILVVGQKRLPKSRSLFSSSARLTSCRSSPEQGPRLYQLFFSALAATHPKYFGSETLFA
jgi:hypothetical protein